MSNLLREALLQLESSLRVIGDCVLGLLDSRLPYEFSTSAAVGGRNGLEFVLRWSFRGATEMLVSFFALGHGVGVLSGVLICCDSALPCSLAGTCL